MVETIGEFCLWWPTNGKVPLEQVVLESVRRIWEGGENKMKKVNRQGHIISKEGQEEGGGKQVLFVCAE